MTEPLVSVIVPAWNSQWTLRQTLESVAAQTCREIEIVIVVDIGPHHHSWLDRKRVPHRGRRKSAALCVPREEIGRRAGNSGTSGDQIQPSISVEVDHAHAA